MLCLFASSSSSSPRHNLEFHDRTREFTARASAFMRLCAPVFYLLCVCARNLPLQT